MMRMAGLAMIVLGLVGLVMSAFDWETMVEPTAEKATAPEPTETAQEEADGDGNDVDETVASPVVNETVDTLDAAAGGPVEPPEPTQEESQPLPAPEIVQPPEPAPEVDVAERGPAHVKVFERNEEQDPSKPTLWAEISAASDTVDEGSGHANFLVTLSEPADRSVVIIFATVDGSANDREDYESQRGTMTFEPGEVSAEIKTPLIDDDVKEDDEQFAIVLNGAPGIVSFKSRRITTTIIDND